MWEERAERARREIAALAASGTGLAELYASSLAVVQHEVPFEQGCWAGVDPESLVMTSITNWRDWGVTEEYSARFAETEYAGQEPNRFAELSLRPRPVARISDAPHRDVVRSVRINEILKPLGLEHELRAAFRVDEACWGVGSIFRESGRDFSDREVEFLAAVTATLAAASRVAVRAEHAAQQMVVTVEPATTHDLTGLLLAAYGVTAREREVCLEVLSGNSTADIALRLYISPHTVHDHLKSLFEKVGVGSRGELVARLMV